MDILGLINHLYIPHLRNSRLVLVAILGNGDAVLMFL